MPDLKGMTVLIIGSGPTTIGQTGECHEGALEACRTLRNKGCRLITVDANPDVVFNSIPRSHHPVIAPLTPETICHIIEAEKPNALLTLFGGRNALQLVRKLNERKTLPDNNIELWGPSKACLNSVRDRDTLQSALSPIGMKTPSIFPVKGLDAAVKKAQQLGFPVVLRCDDAQLLPDGRLIYNQDELNNIGATLSGESSIKFSVETSLLEWQQVEIEVLRDRKGQSVIIGAIEYLDTAEVHPGDAIGVCPPQALTHKISRKLKKQAKSIANHLDIIGNATLRFAYHPSRQDILVLAVHPRYTTCCAMVSRITGASIAKISTLLAAGNTLDQLSDDLPKPIPTENSPKIVGVKWPHWDFMRLEKKNQVRLGPKMQATGHHLGFGNGLIEALQKASRSGCADDCNSILSEADNLDHVPVEELLQRIATPSSCRPPEILAALRKNVDIQEIAQRTHILPWFIEQFKLLKEMAYQIQFSHHQKKRPFNLKLMKQAKSQGFSDGDLSKLMNWPVQKLKDQRVEAGLIKTWQAMPNQSAHIHFSTFGKSFELPDRRNKNKQTIIILGNGAYGVGNGAECDYGIFHAAQTIKTMGYSPIVINNNIINQSSMSGDFITCYADPLNIEEIVSIIENENPIGIITQFAGAVAYKLAKALSSMGFKILGSSKEALDLNDNKIRLKERLRQFGIPQPLSENAISKEEAIELAKRVGYPLLIGGHQTASRNLIRDPQMLDSYLSDTGASDMPPLWMEQLLEYAIEVQAEVMCDGHQSHVAAILEHIELAGVHAGDSSAVLPPYSIAPRHIETITEYCHKIATELSIKGLINIRFGIYRDTVYLLETANNISRNLSMVSKTLNIPLVEWVTRLILGQSLAELDLQTKTPNQCSVRVPVFPFNVFSKIDPLLGPQMRATGQVMALSDTFGMAYFKAMEATATPLPTQGTVLITVTDEDKSSILEPARIFGELGFSIMATKGTHKVLAENGIKSIQVRKLGYGRPNLVDEIKNKNVQIVINTPTGGQGQIDDSVIRKAAIGCRIVNITTPASALAAAKGIAAAIRQSG